MALNPISAAKRMCERSEWSISNLTLQKILYLAHMFHLGIHDAPLVTGHFQAWDYGPVHPEVYHYVKVFGAEPVRNVFRSIENAQEGKETELIDQAVDQLKSKKPALLVQITHRKEGAWFKHYKPNQNNIVIPDSDIKKEYKDLQAQKKVQ